MEMRSKCICIHTARAHFLRTHITGITVADICIAHTRTRPLSTVDAVCHRAPAASTTIAGILVSKRVYMSIRSTEQTKEQGKNWQFRFWNWKRMEKTSSTSSHNVWRPRVTTWIVYLTIFCPGWLWSCRRLWTMLCWHFSSQHEQCTCEQMRCIVFALESREMVGRWWKSGHRNLKAITYTQQCTDWYRTWMPQTTIRKIEFRSHLEQIIF